MPQTLLASLLIALGFATGLRTVTPVAVLCWGAHFGLYPLDHTPFAFLANIASLVIFTVLAVGELIADKLPKTPNRTDPIGLVSRLAFGGAGGAVLASVAGAPLALGIILAVVGAAIGAYTGYLVRRALTSKVGLPDLPVALLEDLIAVFGSFFIVSRF